MSDRQMLLELRGLTVDLRSAGRRLRVVHDTDITLMEGEALGIVGESGSGKSMTGRAIMRLLPKGSEVAGDLRFMGESVLEMGRRKLRDYRATDVAVIHQDPRSHINPVRRIDDYMTEGLIRNRGMGKREANELAIQTLAELGIHEPDRRIRQFPHQLSGGMLQRVMIGVALMSRPRLLLADEPTTGLDVTTQEEVVAILAERRQDESALGLIFITHDLDLAAAITDRIAVMYAGCFVEIGPTESIVDAPRHPYTAALLASRPKTERVEELPTIPGHAQAGFEIGEGCCFADRCPHATERCRLERPELREVDGRLVACHFAEQLKGRLNETASGSAQEDPVTR